MPKLMDYLLAGGSIWANARARGMERRSAERIATRGEEEATKRTGIETTGKENVARMQELGATERSRLQYATERVSNAVDAAQEGDAAGMMENTKKSLIAMNGNTALLETMFKDDAARKGITVEDRQVNQLFNLTTESLNLNTMSGRGQQTELIQALPGLFSVIRGNAPAQQGAPGTTQAPPGAQRLQGPAAGLEQWQDRPAGNAMDTMRNSLRARYRILDEMAKAGDQQAQMLLDTMLRQAPGGETPPEMIPGFIMRADAYIKSKGIDTSQLPLIPSTPWSQWPIERPSPEELQPYLGLLPQQQQATPSEFISDPMKQVPFTQEMLNLYGVQSPEAFANQLAQAGSPSGLPQNQLNAMASAAVPGAAPPAIQPPGAAPPATYPGVPPMQQQTGLTPQNLPPMPQGQPTPPPMQQQTGLIPPYFVSRPYVRPGLRLRKRQLSPGYFRIPFTENLTEWQERYIGQKAKGANRARGRVSSRYLEKTGLGGMAMPYLPSGESVEPSSFPQDSQDAQQQLLREDAARAMKYAQERSKRGN